MKLKILDQRVKEECKIISKIYPLGWKPRGDMIFEKNGILYDLSAADINKLERIEDEGLFRVLDKNM